ncbi:MAG: hypothetical protein QT08_C0017G0006 [archaeon GW2011_AR17]|nr:MAG: hypothetical protein QT08_C0017G0006 [archaeon GW2011_AR17]MBS3154401.1 hypothetical protein [Candidatus Woesearchaeota archaeon]HIH15071.1 hypothetical protein [Nanoarchaeota archaeon]HIH58650.1 hypothetical protein [Nanoarchaeota archaeon]HII14570.1 hypothetical protein [Nanoarchaeota archaeon]
MSFFQLFCKFLLSIAFDVTDFFLGRIPGFGTVFDIAGGFLGLWLWGLPGGLQFLEILDITDQLDSFVPTMTLAGILSLITRGSQ